MASGAEMLWWLAESDSNMGYQVLTGGCLRFYSRVTNHSVFQSPLSQSSGHPANVFEVHRSGIKWPCAGIIGDPKKWWLSQWLPIKPTGSGLTWPLLALFCLQTAEAQSISKAVSWLWLSCRRNHRTYPCKRCAPSVKPVHP